MTPEHLRELRQQLTDAPVQPPSHPWHVVEFMAVGGLSHVGYAPNSDLILVVSSRGRSVVDCLTGKKVARDYEEFIRDLDETRLQCPGIGPLAGQNIRIAGITGGGLPTTTRDGWYLEAIALPWPNYAVFLSQPFKSVADGLKSTTKVGENFPCTYCAHGFADTGNSFVIATTCELSIFSRVPETLSVEKTS